MGRGPVVGRAMLALAVAGGATVLAGCGGSGDAAEGTAGTAGTATAAPATTAPVMTTPAGPTSAPAETAGAPATAAAPAAARPSGSVEVQQGDIGITDLHVFRYGRELTASFRVDGPGYATVAAFSANGRPLGQGAARRRSGPGPLVARLSLRRAQGNLRVVLSVVPEAGGGAPTVVSLRTRPKRASVRLLSPRPGAVLRTDQVRVRLAASAFDITDEGTRPRPRQGHFHITLDDRAYIVHYDTELTFRGLSDGPHRLIVVPARNDHVPIEGLKPITRRFTVRTGFRIPPRSVTSRSYRLLPRPGAEAPSAPVLAWGRQPGARAYRVTVQDARSGRRAFARTTRARTLTVPAGRLQAGQVYVWRVAAVGTRRPRLVGASWFRTP